MPNGLDAALGAAALDSLGRAMARIHGAVPPAGLAAGLRTETFTPRWREAASALLADLPPAADDPAAAALVELLARKRRSVESLIHIAGSLAGRLAAAPFVICHGDIHAGNVLVEGDRVHVIDWDDVRLAPPACDLAFVGSGIGGRWVRADESEAFYRGFGGHAPDRAALAYRRAERIVEDVVVYGRQIFGREGSAADRARGLGELAAQFEPGNVVDIALATAAGVVA